MLELAAISMVNPLTSMVVVRQLPDCGVGRVYIPLISDARRHYVTCDKEKIVLGASMYRYRTVYSFNTIILVVVMFVSLFYPKLNQ